MHGAANATAKNLTREYYPVTLNHKWPQLERLLFVVICSCLGSTMNGFFVAAFFVEHTLNKVGNVFLACIGIADLILTTAVMPVSAVVILSKTKGQVLEWDTVSVCQALYFLTETSTYSYSMFFSLVSAETYHRLCRSTAEYELFLSMRVGLVAVLVFITSTTVAGFGVYMGLDYDYCQRQHYGNFTFKIATFVIFHTLPFLLTLFGLICSAVRIRKRAREQTHYKRSQQYERDHSTTTVNIIAYLLYVSAWIPYIIIIYEYPQTEDNKFYHFAWMGVCRSVVTSLLYSATNRSFRRAFAHLFNYCCCKSTLSGSFSNRHRRAIEYKPADVRVHIMHQAVSVNNPQRAGTSREVQEL